MWQKERNFRHFFHVEFPHLLLHLLYLLLLTGPKRPGEADPLLSDHILPTNSLHVVRTRASTVQSVWTHPHTCTTLTTHTQHMFTSSMETISELDMCKNASLSSQNHWNDIDQKHVAMNSYFYFYCHSLFEG